MTPRQIFIVSRPAMFPFTNIYISLLVLEVITYEFIVLFSCKSLYVVRNRESNKSASWGGGKYHVRNFLHRSVLLNLIRYMLDSRSTYAVKVVEMPFLLMTLISDINGSQLVAKHVLDNNKVRGTSHVMKYRLDHEMFIKQKKNQR